MTDEKKPGDEVVDDMSLEDTVEEKDAKKELDDMSLDENVSADSGSVPKAEDLRARIEKLFPDKVYIYMTPDDPICKQEDGGYSLRRTLLADLTDGDKRRLDRFLKEREG